MVKIATMCGPSSIAKLVQITTITRVYGAYDYSYMGLYTNKHNILGPHILCLSAIWKKHYTSYFPCFFFHVGWHSVGLWFLSIAWPYHGRMSGLEPDRLRTPGDPEKGYLVNVYIAMENHH